MAGVTDVVGVWQHVAQLMTVVALKQRYAGHAKRAALIAAANSYMGRLVVVVDDDVDPSNLADVMWAVTTRCEPAEQIDIVRNAWSSALDPRIPDGGQARAASPRTPRRSSRRCGRSAGRTSIRRPRRSPPTRRARSRQVGRGVEGVNYLLHRFASTFDVVHRPSRSPVVRAFHGARRASLSTRCQHRARVPIDAVAFLCHRLCRPVRRGCFREASKGQGGMRRPARCLARNSREAPESRPSATTKKYGRQGRREVLAGGEEETSSPAP